jgi:hypothetical protein
MSNLHIYTEIIRCGQIGTQAISSFHKHHNLKLNIYCSDDDLQYIPDNSNNIIHIIQKNSELYNNFNEGHKGTSHLWTNLILDLPNEIKYLIHFDSDVFFFGNLVDDIIKELENYDLVGPIRPYKNNPNLQINERRDDVLNTFCFGFNRDLIKMRDKKILWNWVRGFPVNFPHKVIDFFDPVSFHILYNGGKIKFIDENTIGGINYLFSRKNKHEELNAIFDVGDKIIHFASVGSGQNFNNMLQNKKKINVPMSYIKFALERFDIYSQLFFNKKVINSDKNDILVDKLKKLIFV